MSVGVHEILRLVDEDHVLGLSLGSSSNGTTSIASVTRCASRRTRLKCRRAEGDEYPAGPGPPPASRPPRAPSDLPVPAPP